MKKSVIAGVFIALSFTTCSAIANSLALSLANDDAGKFFNQYLMIFMAINMKTEMITHKAYFWDIATISQTRANYLSILRKIFTLHQAVIKDTTQL
ncbi:systemic factor protein SfpA [Escherichia coli]|uniref:Systemic factor protein SfpA n=1 Tax=Escherichia coli TaxID=562 RepID=A0A377EC91_ECOLX|nr:systemic factor protein SfpA [Escherichia coli]